MFGTMMSLLDIESIRRVITFFERCLRYVEDNHNSKGLLVIYSYRMKAKCTGTVTYGIPLLIRVAYAQVLVVSFLDEIADNVCEKKNHV